MSVARYKSYKDSGVEWLGEVPSHWVVTRLKHTCTCLDGKRIPLNSEQRSTRQGDVPYWGANSVVDYVDEAIFDEVLILLGEDGAPFFDRTKPVAFNVSGRIWPNNHVHVLRPNIVDTSRFIVESLNTTDYSHFIDGSTRDKLTQSAMNNIPILSPPLPEQRAIAGFLDRETGKIDALVAEQRRLIELLKEKRQALISHAVTKGLDPHAPMKPSGIDWLGDVPAHWEVLKLGLITLSRCDGPFGSGLKSEHYTESGVRVIRLQNIKAAGFDGTDEAFVSQEYFEKSLAGHDVKVGDVLIAGLGDDNNLVGRACVAPQGIEPAMVKADCFRFRIDSTHAIPEFIAVQLSISAVCDSGVLSSGSTRSRINLSVTGTRMVGLPPLDEQRSIVDYLESETARLDELTSEAERGIELLQERRTALISAAVTGKIDVRHLAGEGAA